MRRLTGFAATLLFAALPAIANETGLMDRTVIFKVMTWDDPDLPYLISRDFVGVVGDGPEFGMQREGFIGIDVVPVLIDVSADRITFSYATADPGTFALAGFNGYTLRFPIDCVLISDAAIDLGGTSLPLKPDALTITPQSLSLNVAGLPFDRDDKITLNLTVQDCPLS